MDAFICKLKLEAALFWLRKIEGDGPTPSTTFQASQARAAMDELMSMMFEQAAEQIAADAKGPNGFVLDKV